MPSHKKVEANRFAMVPRNDIPRSAFDVEFTHKTTMGTGVLIPIYVDEVLPGDSHRLEMSLFARLSTPIVPVMDNLILESFFFFVPNRLVWENWQRFMGEQNDPTDSTVFLTPYIAFTATNILPTTIPDYMGVTGQLTAGGVVRVQAMPFRGYWRIWNEWFRDEDLQSLNAAGVVTDNGPDSEAAYVTNLAPRGKRHDYFTSCRPWPQKPVNAAIVGDQGMWPIGPGQNFTGVAGAAGAGAPVTGLGVGAAAVPGAGTSMKQAGGRVNTYANEFSTTTTPFLMRSDAGDVAGNPDVRVLVNDIRTANIVQVMLERNARGGTRYTEIVRSHFGVVSPDARLQRTEYLGGGRSFITVNPVTQTAPSGIAGTTTVMGEQAAVGTVVAQNHGFSQSFTEHGHIIGLVSVRPELSYQQGVNRMWKRRTQFDFYWPGLAHLGEQSVMRSEIYSTGVDADDQVVFGYQERWSEYKYAPSRVSGVMRSTAATPLDVWHFSERFTAPPVLNGAFIETPWEPVDRVLQVSTNFQQQFLVDTLFRVRKVRAMPMFSIPGLGPRL